MPIKTRDNKDVLQKVSLLKGQTYSTRLYLERICVETTRHILNPRYGFLYRTICNYN